MPHVLRDLHWAAAQESTHPALHCRPVSFHLACNRIEAFAFIFSVRVLLHIVPHRKERRECIGQIQQCRGRYDADEAKIIRNCCRDDKGNGPPDWHDDGVEDFAAAGDERRCTEDVHEDVVIEYFNADVAIQSTSDEGRDERDHVAGCLPAVDRDALVADSKR